MPHQEGVGQEHPQTHQIIIGSIIVFLIIWALDSFVFVLSTQLSIFVHWSIRLIICLIFVGIALLFMKLSEDAVFKNNQENKALVKTGIFAYVRNPMYLATPIIFIGLIFLTLSLISIIPLVLTFYSYNIFVKYEENELEKIFGQEYLEYKKRVPRWRLRLTPAKF